MFKQKYDKIKLLREKRSVIMNSEELKNLIESARVAKGISQRDLAKLTGISRSTLNDLINGIMKKVDIDDLRKIAETLDMSLQKLLKAASYDEMSLQFRAHKSKDKYIDKSSKDLKELLEKYKESEINLLQFDIQKRKKVSDARQKLFYTIEHLQIMKDNKDSLYTIDKAIEGIQYAFDELEFAEHKYNYEKLPKKNQFIINKNKMRRMIIMDIKFEKDDFKFNVRSSCIIKDKEHRNVLLTNMRAVKDHETFLLPGGRLEILENSQDAIYREMQEELGITLDYRLISIEENIVEDTKFHMLEFVFYAEIESFDEIRTLDDGWDKFRIVQIEDIENVDIRPQTVKRLIQQENYNGITHNINYDWAECNEDIKGMKK